MFEQSPQDTNILRQQGALILIAEELQRDINAFAVGWDKLRDDVEAVSIKFELMNTERLSIGSRMASLDRMISEVKG